MITAMTAPETMMMMIDTHFVLNQHPLLSDYSLKQQSAGRHVIPLGYLIIISSHPFFPFIP
jgi:hypothetical protein